MKKIVLGICVLSFCISAVFATSDSVHPLPEEYFSQAEFEKAVGGHCLQATDGCNDYIFKNGKIAGGTKKACANHTPQWTCLHSKDSDEYLIQQPICTMEFAPVCGIDRKTYSNKCMAGDVEIEYVGECIGKENGLSQNDQSSYSSAKKQLGSTTTNKIDKAVAVYKSKLEKNYSDEKISTVNTKVIEKVERVIFDLIMQYPADIGLPEKVNRKYLILNYLKLELQMYGYELSQ